MSESNSIKAVLRRLARSLYGTSRARRVSSSCVVETCEPRVLLATSVWSSNTGGSWFSAANWDGGVPDTNKGVYLGNQYSGVLTFGGKKASAGNLAVGSTSGPGQAIFDLNGGRLTVENAKIGGSTLGQLPGTFIVGDLREVGNVTVRNGAMTIEKNAFVGGRPTEPLSVLNYTSQKSPYSQLNVGAGGRVDVGQKLSMGTGTANGFVYVYAGGKLTTDNVAGTRTSWAYVYNTESEWLNNGIFAANAWIGQGGYIGTSTFTGKLSLNGGTLSVRNYAPETQTLSSGQLYVAGGSYNYENTDVPNGASLSLVSGTGGTNLGPLTVGGQSIQTKGIVTVSSGSKIDWNSISLKQSGELHVTGSGTWITSTARASNTTPQITVEGYNSQIRVLDGAILYGRELILRGGASASVSGLGSRIAASQSVRIGGSSTLFPSDYGTSTFDVGAGGLLSSPGAVTVIGGGQLNLGGGTVSPQNVIIDGGELTGGGLISTGVEIHNGGRVRPGTMALRTKSVQFDTGTRFVAQLDGTNAGTQYSQLDVTGTVSLNNSTLQVSEKFASRPGDRFQIIRNDGTDPVNGNFAGLPEGGVVVLDGLSYTITYQGGTGNDVVLTSNGNLPVIVSPTSATSNNQPEFLWTSVASAATYSFHVNNLTTGQQNVIDVQGLTAASFTTTSPLDLGTYQAFVQAYDSAGQPSLMSPARQFTIVPPFTPNIFTDSVDVNIGNGVALDSAGKTSLRAVIQESNALPGTDKITLGAGTFNLSRAGASENAAATGDLDITDDLIIQGAGRDVTFIDARSLDRVFHIRPGARLTLRDVTIKGGLLGGTQWGAGILNEGMLNLIDCKLMNNTAVMGGGLANVVMSASAVTANVSNTVFTGNSAEQGGGAVLVRGGGTLNLDNVTITSNTVPTATGSGGGIFIDGGAVVDIRNSLLENNSALQGGALYAADASTMTVRNSEFRNNTARNGAGALIQGGAQLEIEGSLFSLNTASSSAGAIYLNRTGSVLISGTQFLDNLSSNRGGAIYAEAGSSLSLIRSEFRRNQALSVGGAVNAQEIGQLVIADSTFDANQVGGNAGGAGAIAISDTNAKITRSTFSNNVAQSAGAISADNVSRNSEPNPVTTLEITNSTFSGNRAIRDFGGALLISDFDHAKLATTLTNVTITGNQAGAQGGGIYCNSISTDLRLQLLNTIVAGNTAATGNPDVSGPFNSLGHNLIGNVGSATGFGATGDLIGGNGTPVINPVLGPLQDNGGSTFTRALLGGSPAIDAGAIVTETLDQRGFARMQGSAPDIGAFEQDVDLKITAFRTDGGQTLFVDYEILGRNLTAVEIGFFTSLSAQKGEFDNLLKTVTLTTATDLTIGTHTVAIPIGGGANEVPFPGVGTPEFSSNYRILAVLDPDNAVGELDDNDQNLSNNTAALVGVYHAPGGGIYIHGSAGSDDIGLTVGSVRVEINGQTYVYQNADVSNVVLRSHAGNDVLREEAILPGLQVIGGRGDNEVLWDNRGTTLNLPTISSTGLSGIAVIDLTGSHTNRLTLNYDSVVATYGSSRVLRVTGDTSDGVYLGTGWTSAGTASVFGVDYYVFKQQEATLQIDKRINRVPTSVTLSSSVLLENRAVGTNVGTFSTVDPDSGNTHTYTLVSGSGGGDNGAFQISGNTLKTSAVLDFETKSIYSIRVRSTDQGGLSTFKALTIRLLDQLDGTLGIDQFVVSVDANNVIITRASNGGAPVAEGTFTLTPQLLQDGLAIAGLGASDTVMMVGLKGNDSFSMTGSAIVLNGLKVTAGLAAKVTLDGGAGDDVYRFNANLTLNNVTITDSAGLDTLDFSATTVNVSANLGVSSLQTVSPGLKLSVAPNTIENLIGGSGNDTLLGNSLNNLITGNAGNDTIYGLQGNDTLLGGLGDDTYVFAAATAAESDIVTESTNQGTDTLNFAALPTNVSVRLNSTAVQAVDSNRTLKLNSTTTFENVIGGSGNDKLIGNTLNNRITGNAGNDTIYGLQGSDTLLGGLGDDSYVFAAATAAEADIVTELANQGTDTLNFAALTTNISVRLNSTAVQAVHSNRTLKLNSTTTFENVIGGAGNDKLIGNTLNNRITGNAGNDTIYGLQGSDALLGGLGDDIYVFGPATSAEADTATEGTNGGVDTLNFSAITTSITFSLATSAVQSVHTNRTLKLNSTTQFENIAGGSGNDILTGNSVANVLIGNAGNDQLTGNAGRDILIGGLGLDTLNGGADDDILIAGRTTHDALFSNLNALQAEWVSGNIYASRITSLRSGVSSPIVSLKAKTNVLNDSGNDDSLTGGTGTDWFFKAVDDLITDLVSGEILDLL